jgi:hypothetical protein
LKPEQGFGAVLPNTFKTWKMGSQKWDPRLQSSMTSLETQARFCCGCDPYSQDLEKGISRMKPHHAFYGVRGGWIGITMGYLLVSIINVSTSLKVKDLCPIHSFRFYFTFTLFLIFYFFSLLSFQ